VEEHYEKLSHLDGPRTPIRVAVLEEICANGSLSERELRDIFVEGDDEEWDFEVSKPTLRRQFDVNPENSTGDAHSLVERGWVKDVSEGRGNGPRYAATPIGRMLREEVGSLFDLFDLIDDVSPELEPFFEVVTESDVEMERDVLEELTEADVHASKPTDVYGVFSEYMEFVSDTEHIRGISWVSSELFVDIYHKHLVEDEKEIELIFASEVLETLVGQHTEKYREMLETDRLSVFECDVFPFGMTAVESGIAWAYFEPESGTPEYELMTESEKVREWAVGVFEEYKKEGREVTEEALKETRKKTSEA